MYRMRQAVGAVLAFASLGFGQQQQVVVAGRVVRDQGQPAAVVDGALTAILRSLR